VFRQLLPWHNYGFSLDVPVLTSIDPFATILAISAALALFRFKIGVVPTLLGCSLAGVVLVLAFSGVK
jgi:chromate transporter